MSPRRASLLGVVWTLATAVPAVGQSDAGSAAGPPTWRPVLASAVLPGLGQFDLGQRRGWAYVAAEALVWTGYGLSRRAGLDDRDAYRDLAWREARGSVEPRRDGDFEYFERLGTWTRSGAFDVAPLEPGLQPESDPATFNGDAWRLARDLVGLPPDAGPDDPRYARALELYRERAYPGDLVWDWTDRPEAQDRYRSLVRESDQHLRDATIILGGVFLNHIVSAADAYLSQAVGSAVQFGVEPTRLGFDFIPYLTLRVFHP